MHSVVVGVLILLIEFRDGMKPIDEVPAMLLLSVQLVLHTAGERQNLLRSAWASRIPRRVSQAAHRQAGLPAKLSRTSIAFSFIASPCRHSPNGMGSNGEKTADSSAPGSNDDETEAIERGGSRD